MKLFKLLMVTSDNAVSKIYCGIENENLYSWIEKSVCDKMGVFPKEEGLLNKIMNGGATIKISGMILGVVEVKAITLREGEIEI